MPTGNRMLPDTLHGLLSAAVDDMRSLDRERYVPRWDEWHQPTSDCCQVCLAGSVLAGTLGVPDDVELHIDSFDCMFRDATHEYRIVGGKEGHDVHIDENRLVADRLMALEYLRNGMVSDAYRVLYKSDMPHHLPFRDGAFEYTRNNEFVGWEKCDLFLSDLDTLHAALLEHGI